MADICLSSNDDLVIYTVSHFNLGLLQLILSYNDSYLPIKVQNFLE